MQVRSKLRYSSLVESRAVGCSSIHRATYAATEGDADALIGACHVPRTRSACWTSTHSEASVRLENVAGADTYRPSGPITRARNRPDGNRSTVPNARRDRLRPAALAGPGPRSSPALCTPPSVSPVVPALNRGVRHHFVLLGDRERPLLLPRGPHKEVCRTPLKTRVCRAPTWTRLGQARPSKLAMPVRSRSPAPRSDRQRHSASCVSSDVKTGQPLAEVRGPGPTSASRRCRAPLQCVEDEIQPKPELPIDGVVGLESVLYKLDQMRILDHRGRLEG